MRTFNIKKKKGEFDCVFNYFTQDGSAKNSAHTHTRRQE
jgi:hypothetical protein